ncbi:unnamed protein product [Leptidea sinapis]|uniref:Uncharacterized protein n=1 Tax=Leptidea sinapis TaxID=189913 RepID=A0A5E4R5K4_9NEOP|nr:unnamed protein product [Leptidea sinapis]
MGRHRDWRKIAKRERRRKIRKHNAKNREPLEQQEIEQIEEDNRRENEKWLQAELITITRIKKLEAERQRNLQKQLVAEAKMREEWEEEKLRREKESQRLKQIEEENLARQAKFLNSLEEFLNGNLSEPPEELSTYRETKPNMELCPFFVKTSCCRFGDQCSRNHQYPAISNNANFNEYDTDVMLEYEESETSRHYKDFFYDVLPEFQKHGKITQFKVCNNYEKHLRGNTYVEYLDIRSAVRAYRALHSRWYGGRQITLQFCQITSWKNAICGLQSRKRCPKGRSCNFLHVFANPENLFMYYDIPERKPLTSKTSWRWSESPERTSPKRKRSKSKDREKERSHHRHKRKHSKRR